MTIERDALSSKPLVRKLCLSLAALFLIGSGNAVAQNIEATGPAGARKVIENQNQQKSGNGEIVADSNAILLDGMIDGDVPSVVSDSIIPRVLSALEHKKLGMKQARFALPALVATSTALPAGKVDGERYPETFVQQFGEFTEPLPESGTERSAGWEWSWCHWSAPNTFSNPRYFEDRMLERHGQECIAGLQPLASGARFFATVPMLPYLWTLSNPFEREYSLGYYPAGQCIPVMMQLPPYENRAALVEAGAAAALIIGLP